MTAMFCVPITPNLLLTFAEESRKDTVMILAGYDADMNRFMESNVGLHEGAFPQFQR